MGPRGCSTSTHHPSHRPPGLEVCQSAGGQRVAGQGGLRGQAVGGGVCLLWDKLPLPLPALLLGTSWHCQLPLPASLQYKYPCWHCVAPPSDPPPPPHTHTHLPPIPRLSPSLSCRWPTSISPKRWTSTLTPAQRCQPTPGKQRPCQPVAARVLGRVAPAQLGCTAKDSTR